MVSNAHKNLTWAIWYMHVYAIRPAAAVSVAAVSAAAAALLFRLATISGNTVHPPPQSSCKH
jgi:hypothetical protein